MKLFDKIKRFFKRNKVCPKCDAETYGKKFCIKCQEYIMITEEQKNKDIKAKDDLRRRNWIRVRDEFLKEVNGSN